MNLQISGALEVQATCSDLPLPHPTPSLEVWLPQREEREEGQASFPALHSHTPLPQSGVIGYPGTGSARPAYEFLKQASPAGWYLQQSHPQCHGAGFNVNCSEAETRSWGGSATFQKPLEYLACSSPRQASSLGVQRLGCNAPGWLLLKK
jgi:hypothetical protein